MMNDSANPSGDGSLTVEPSLEPASYAELDFAEAHEANPEFDEEEWPEGPPAPWEHEPLHENNEPDHLFEDEAANNVEDAVVMLKGGEQVPVRELKLGYMRDRDYRQKTQSLAERGRALEDMASRVSRSVGLFTEYLASQVPDEPPPALALQNPAEYARWHAGRNEALSRVDLLMQLANVPTQVGDDLTSSQFNELLATEDAALTQAFPETAADEAREAFFQNIFQTASSLGFSDEEVRAATDHRLFKLAHYARLGLAAEQAKSRVLAKLARAPAATKARPKGQNQQSARNNHEAMKKLARTGSLRDALAIDFD